MDDYKARCRAVRSAAPFVGTGVQPQGAAKHPPISKKGKATHYREPSPVRAWVPVVCACCVGYRIYCLRRRKEGSATG